MAFKREEVYSATLEYFKGDELAANVWIDKYCLKEKAGKEIVYHELTPDDMHHRLSKELARIEAKYPNPMSEDEIFELIKGFKYIVPQGSPMAGIGNNFALSSISNCFVVGGHVDSYGGIMNADEEQVQLMKRRGGVGNDLSHLRPAMSLANGAPLGPNAGATLYMDRYSNSTKEVQQDGRRGALMLSISIIHPDAGKFIDKKMTPGQVTGANVSVKVVDDFMSSLELGLPFYQVFPIDYSIGDVCVDDSFEMEFDELYEGRTIDGQKTYFKKLDPNKLWEQIVHNAWKSAEPGILFWDKIISESPVNGYGSEWTEVSTNPCFVGDTIVATADGRHGVTFNDLAKEGKAVPVYCADEAGNLAIRTMRNPRKTGSQQKILKITLSNGKSIRCTENHKFYLKDMEKVEAKDLNHGMKLHILTKAYEDVDKGTNRTVLRSNGEREVSEHRFIYNNLVGETPSHMQIHHKNENPYDNRLENLQSLTIPDHNKIHNKSYVGQENGNFSGVTNKELYEKFKKLTFDKGARLTRSEYRANGGVMWTESISYRQPLGKTALIFLQNLYEEYEEYGNHTIVSVQEDGVEDVYNGTVDEFHNYFVGEFEEKTRDRGYSKLVYTLVANCGEIPLCPYDSCRLLAINLFSYIHRGFTKHAVLEDAMLIDHVKKAMRLMDDIVDLEIEKVNSIIKNVKENDENETFKRVELELWGKILEKAEQGRRTGFGVLGEGDLIAAIGYRYGTPEATLFSEKLHQLIATAAFESSVELAKERGAFPIFNHKNEQGGFLTRVIHDNELMTPELLEEYKLYGRRNIGMLTIAPTGTTALMTQTTSGIEPLFTPFYYRKKKVVAGEDHDFVDQDGELMKEFTILHRPFIQWYATEASVTESIAEYQLSKLTKEARKQVFEASPYYNATAQDVDYIEKVKMQGAVQKWVDHSISVTVNMPEHASKDTVAGVYKTAWESGCKGITVYREGSRGNVLATESVKVGAVEEFEYISALERPASVDCDVYFRTAHKEDFIIFVGVVGGKPYEIFAVPHNDKTHISKRVKKGAIVKVDKGQYQFISECGSHTIENLAEHMIESEQRETRNVSAMLRFRIDPAHIVEKVLSKFTTISSFHKVIEKVLRIYIEVPSKENTCPECGGQISYTEGCLKCVDCGYSKCG